MAESNRKTKESLRKWLSDPYNIVLIAVIIASFIIRIYFHIHTTNQPIWWDEAEYLSTAKHWAFGVPYEINLQRPPLFPLLGAMLLFLGLGESALKFILVLIPSTLLPLFVFLLGKEMFGKRVGIFAAVGSTVMWSYVFWTERFQPDFLSINFQLLAILFFWKMFKEPNKRSAIYAGIFTALALYFKVSALLIPMFVLVFVIFKDGISFVKHKEYWISAAAFLVMMVPFFLWQYSLFGNPVAFALSYSDPAGKSQLSPGWGTLGFFYSFPESLVFILFIGGLILALGEISISFDIMLKNKEKKINAKIFSIILFAVTSLFYIFFIRGNVEDRWVFIIAPFIFYIAGEAMFFIYDMILKYKKGLAFLLVAVVLSVFVFYQIQHASSIIDVKKDSYYPIKESSIFIKDNSGKDESVLSISLPQTTYYSERKTYTYSGLSNESALDTLILEKKPSYILASIFENHPSWVIQQRTYAGGGGEIAMDYFNSSVKFLPDGKISSVDLKKSVEKKDFSLEMVYPQQMLNGAFVYKINYK